ncbi:MAG: hypothetical protein HPY75_04295 [Actinobacteria bacterium]|nr:hypothetical protein [Actinomycetota bacterium]
MAIRKANAIIVWCIGALLILLLAGTLAGCGSKEGTEKAGEATGAGAENGAASGTSQPQEYVFSVTASQDTKTETFQVATNSQELYYDLVGGDDATVTITVFSSDGKMQAGANAFEPGPHQKTIYLKPGTYYMEILPENCTVEVKVQD